MTYLNATTGSIRMVTVRKATNQNCAVPSVTRSEAMYALPVMGDIHKTDGKRTTKKMFGINGRIDISIKEIFQR